MTDEQLRTLWRSKGGSFHGPYIETGTMPEHQLLPFLRELMTLPQRAVLVTPDTIRSGTPNPPKKVWSAAQRLAGLLADMPSNVEFRGATPNGGASPATKG